ncbi:guanylin [Erinaceus europaeus]|uniref:Guanylin n=1 Tax=Erinaceus europaeus TaxID=9365 RepID=A0A1S2ZXK2_ERIEU|nr:guanylin [Erinaceus europaeus]
MNTFLLCSLCLLGAWASLADGVTVQDGEFSFPLESVKKLKELQEPQVPGMWNRKKFAGTLVPALCKNPQFPKELLSLCKETNAPEILKRLATIAEDPSTCEICAFAACAGC